MSPASSGPLLDSGSQKNLQVSTRHRHTKQESEPHQARVEAALSRGGSVAVGATDTRASGTREIDKIAATTAWAEAGVR